MKARIAIFASGTGTNVENCIRYFADSRQAEVVLVLSNNPKAGALERANRAGVATTAFDREDLYATGQVLQRLHEQAVDWVVLAGFLWKFPPDILRAFPNRVINLHPALLPKFGGKGMYGMHVHRAVVDAGERETGITIHYVNENYDEGKIIFQAQTAVSPTDTPEQVADKIHSLEQKHFPKVIEELVAGFVASPNKRI